jgi:hypothetical protein
MVCENSRLVWCCDSHWINLRGYRWYVQIQLLGCKDFYDYFGNEVITDLNGSFSAASDGNTMGGQYDLNDNQIILDRNSHRAVCKGSPERGFSKMLSERVYTSFLPKENNFEL